MNLEIQQDLLAVGPRSKVLLKLTQQRSLIEQLSDTREADLLDFFLEVSDDIIDLAYENYDVPSPFFQPISGPVGLFFVHLDTPQAVRGSTVARTATLHATLPAIHRMSSYAKNAFIINTAYQLETLAYQAHINGDIYVPYVSFHPVLEGRNVVALKTRYTTISPEQQLATEFGLTYRNGQYETYAGGMILIDENMSTARETLAYLKINGDL